MMPSSRRILPPATRLVAAAAAVTLLLGGRPQAQPQQDLLPPATATAIDRAAVDVLAKTGAPSVSVAVVRDGKPAYVRAYGKARLQPDAAATPQMRYSIGSISKQFTAAALLLLAQDGKLSLDDRVSRWLPELTRAGEVTVRQLLSMTSGYQDFWPQDYVMPGMLKDVTPDAILRGWAHKPLDFEPGTKWQYSNTNYVIAGLIAERAAGQPLFDFLKARVFTPLGMTSVMDTDQAPLPASDPMRYRRFALGPPRPAPKEGKGWMFAAGELAMTARDLATWDISLIDQTVLSPASYRALETQVLLTNGAPTGYGLGVQVVMSGGRRLIAHSGEVSGFTAENDVYPDERTAIVVLTNLDASAASSRLATAIAGILFTSNTGGSEQQRATEQARSMFEGLQQGKVDRTQLTENLSAYFNAEALADYKASLGPLGKPQAFTQSGQSLRGGMIFRRFQATFGARTVSISTFAMPDGKLEQFLVSE